MSTPSRNKVIPRFDLLRLGYSRTGQERWIIAPWEYEKIEEDFATLNIAMQSVAHLVELYADPDAVRFDDLLPDGTRTGQYAWMEMRDVRAHPRIKYAQILWLTSPDPQDSEGELSKVRPSGSISYLRDGQIGKAWLGIWKDGKPYYIDFRCGEDGIYVHKLDTLIETGNPDPLFKFYYGTIYKNV